MRLDTIGVMSPGDMGHGIGRALRENGKRVLTNLTGRSKRSRDLAEAAGLEDAGSLDAIMAEADLMLSILPPSAAEDFANEAATAMAAAGRTPMFADLNAISPATLHRRRQRDPRRWRSIYRRQYHRADTRQGGLAAGLCLRAWGTGVGGIVYGHNDLAVCRRGSR